MLLALIYSSFSPYKPAQTSIQCQIIPFCLGEPVLKFSCFFFPLRTISCFSPVFGKSFLTPVFSTSTCHSPPAEPSHLLLFVLVCQSFWQKIFLLNFCIEVSCYFGSLSPPTITKVSGQMAQTESGTLQWRSHGRPAWSCFEPNSGTSSTTQHQRGTTRQTVELHCGPALLLHSIHRVSSSINTSSWDVNPPGLGALHPDLHQVFRWFRDMCTVLTSGVSCVSDKMKKVFDHHVSVTWPTTGQSAILQVCCNLSILAVKTSCNDSAVFLKGLSGDIKDELAIQDDPPSLNQLIDLAIRLDRVPAPSSRYLPVILRLLLWHLHLHLPHLSLVPESLEEPMQLGRAKDSAFAPTVLSRDISSPNAQRCQKT